MTGDCSVVLRVSESVAVMVSFACGVWVVEVVVSGTDAAIVVGESLVSAAPPLVVEGSVDGEAVVETEAESETEAVVEVDGGSVLAIVLMSGRSEGEDEIDGVEPVLSPSPPRTSTITSGKIFSAATGTPRKLSAITVT